MASISLDRVITGNYVLALGQAQSSSKGFDARSITNPQSTSDALRSSLRVGAQTFANAVQNLNSAISYLSVTEGTLQKLSDITDSLMEVTRRATLSSTSTQARGALNLQFKKLGAEFAKTIDEATVGSRQYMSVADLSEIFKAVGLDKDKSESIAEVFSQFVNPAQDDNLASDVGVKGKAAVIPPGAYTKTGSATSGVWVPEKISDHTNGTDGAIAADGANVQKYTVGPTPRLTATGADGDGGFLFNGVTFTLIKVNETTGYSVIKSAEDFVGRNGANANQLFLLNDHAEVVQQITNNTLVGDPLTVTDLDFSNSTSTINFILSGQYGGVTGVQMLSITGLGSDPATVSRSTLQAGTATQFTDVAISDNSTSTTTGYAAWVNSTTTIATFKNLSAGTTNAYLAGVAGSEKIGFLDNDTLAISRTVGGGNYNIEKFAFADTSFANTLVSSDQVGVFNTLQHGSGSNGYVVYQDTSNGDIKLIKDDATTVTTYDIMLSDTVTRLNLAYDGSNVDIGVVGALRSVLSGDTDSELYRFNAATGTSTLAQLKQSNQYDRVFASDRSIIRRADAFQMLEDLKALKGVLKDNITAITHAISVVGDNLKLARATGFAFLNESDALTSETDADKVAQKIIEDIRRDSKGALNQVENLQAITVAALTSPSSS